MKIRFSKTTLAVIGLLALGILGAITVVYITKNTIKKNVDDPVATSTSYERIYVKESDNKRWYEEEFVNPLDVSIKIDEHKRVYQRIQDHVSFVVKQPQYMPENFYLTTAKSYPVYVDSDKGDVYTIAYHNPSTDEYIFVSGSKEKEDISDYVLEDIQLDEYRVGTLVNMYQTNAIYVSDTRDGEEITGSYSVSSQAVTTEYLIEVARSFEIVNE